MASHSYTHHGSILRRRSIGAAFWLGTAGAIMTGGCAAIPSPTADYLAADRATYNAIAPEYADYVAADSSLSVDQKDRRQRTLQTWQDRITHAQNAALTTAPAMTEQP